MATEVVPMDDKELFSAAMADAPAEVETPVEQPQEQVEQPRDEHGRFAPKTETAPQADAAPTQQQPEAVETKDDGGQVPSWRLREIREERDALARRAEENERAASTYQQRMAEMERRLADLQKPKADPVNFFDDPDKAFGQRVAPIEERFSQLESNFRTATSRLMAIAEHGKAAVAEAEQAVAEARRTNDPSLAPLVAQLRVTDDPFGAAMQWHSNQKLAKETGGNLAAYKDKILAAAMADPAFQAKVIEAARGQANNGGAPPNIKLPPSLNKTAGSGVTASELASEDMSDASLFRHAVGSGRR